jgi:hypothetical protein
MSDADRWRALAAEAPTAAASMTDPQMSRVLWRVALGYRALADHADARPCRAHLIREIAESPKQIGGDGHKHRLLTKPSRMVYGLLRPMRGRYI